MGFLKNIFNGGLSTPARTDKFQGLISGSCPAALPGPAPPPGPLGQPQGHLPSDRSLGSVACGGQVPRVVAASLVVVSLVLQVARPTSMESNGERGVR